MDTLISKYSVDYSDLSDVKFYVQKSTGTYADYAIFQWDGSPLYSTASGTIPNEDTGVNVEIDGDGNLYETSRTAIHSYFNISTSYSLDSNNNPHESQLQFIAKGEFSKNGNNTVISTSKSNNFYPETFGRSIFYGLIAMTETDSCNSSSDNPRAQYQFVRFSTNFRSSPWTW